nr:MAG TPA: hypothetical protein [Caudoviricetes sp.]
MIKFNLITFFITYPYYFFEKDSHYLIVFCKIQ